MIIASSVRKKPSEQWVGVFQSKWRQPTSQHPLAVRMPPVSNANIVDGAKVPDSEWLTRPPASPTNLHLKQFISVAFPRNNTSWWCNSSLSLSKLGKIGWENTRKPVVLLPLFRNQPEITSNAAEGWKIPTQQKPCFALWKSPVFSSAFLMFSTCSLHASSYSERRDGGVLLRGKDVAWCIFLCACVSRIVYVAVRMRRQKQKALFSFFLSPEKMFAIGGFVVQHICLFLSTPELQLSKVYRLQFVTQALKSLSSIIQDSKFIAEEIL